MTTTSGERHRLLLFSKPAYWRVISYFTVGAIAFWLVLPHRTKSEFLESVDATMLRLRGDALARRMHSLVPKGADCGRVYISGDPRLATECAFRAFADNK